MLIRVISFWFAPLYRLVDSLFSRRLSFSFGYFFSRDLTHSRMKAQMSIPTTPTSAV